MVTGTVAELLEQAASARREHRPIERRAFIFEAIALSRALGSDRDLVLALKSLAQLERDSGKLDAALRNYLDAAAICRERDEPLLLAHTIRHVGDVHGELQEWEQAEEHCAAALAIYRQHEDVAPLDLANAIRSVAIVREGSGDAIGARSLWQEAKTLYAATGITAGVAECTEHLSRL